MRQPKRILVTPLNWGLGHATRCIPIIKELQTQGAEVFLASDGRSLQLLKKEFPSLTTFDLPEYGIEYRSNSILTNLLRVAPNLLRIVFLENRRIQKLIKEHNINGVISDNRLGCFSNKKPSVFITHQINLIVPNKVIQWLSRQVNYYFIKQYDECWIPDISEEPNLSGTLSHNTLFDSKVKFIGALSRMNNFSTEKKHDVVAVISGPEPQRTKLEKVFIEQAKKLPYKFLIIQGKPESDDHFFIEKNIEVIACLTTEALNKAILASDLFVGRSGYSSIMDLAKLQKAALFIPTPGQTEQEYLAELYTQSGIFHSQKQMNFDLKNGIQNALKKGHLNNHFFDEKKMKSTINQFLEKC